MSVSSFWRAVLGACIALLTIIGLLLLEFNGIPFIELGFAQERSYTFYIKNMIITFMLGATGLLILDTAGDNVQQITQMLRSRHFAYQESLRGTTLSFEAQHAAWNSYYQSLSDTEKFEVWQHYYASI